MPPPSRAPHPAPRTPVNRRQAIHLLGPTASGKSAIAMALAQHHDIEIISVDSAQVYRGMDVGTAKPSAAERAAVPHHLIDIIEPTEAYSAARFRTDALRLMGEIHARGRLPVLVGGTMLYFKALDEGLSNLPEADANIRKTLEAEAAQLGWPAMHALLAKVDAETAARLKPNDSQRIQRALEVFRISGKPMSALQGSRMTHDTGMQVLKIALVPDDRAVLHERIAVRFDAMLAHGLVDELRLLRRDHVLKPDMPSMRCVGYRQAWEYLDGTYDMKALRERGIAATRQLAKRQLTWLRSMEGLETFDCLRGALLQVVTERVEKWTQG